MNSLRVGLREVTNGLDLLGDTMTVDVITEEVYLWNAKNTLVRIDDDPGRSNMVRKFLRCCSGLKLAMMTTSMYAYAHEVPTP